MLVHRSALRWVLFVFAVASACTVLLASKPVNPATQEAHFTKSIPAEPQQIATSDERASTIASAIPTAPSQSDSEEAECEHLPRDHPLRLKLNGRRLPLDYAGLEKGSEKSLLKDAKVLPLSDGRLLAGLGDTLYMLDQRKHVEWKDKPSWIIWDFAVVESTGMVYGTAGDNVMFILDASTGRQLYTEGLNGQRAFARVVPFGKDECLITGSLAGYREGLQEWSFGRVEMVETDWITAWRGTEVLWSADFPPDADLVVNGDRIYAVAKTDKSIYFREIVPPKSN